MKKFLVVSLMLVLLSGFVAAQEVEPGLGVSAEVTGKYDIVNYTGYDSGLGPQKKVPDAYRDTLAGAVPVDGTITFTAQDEAAGVKVVLDLGYLFNPGGKDEGLFEGDNAAHVWFKPFKSDLLTIRAGAKPSDGGTLRYGNLSSEPDNIIGNFGRVIVEDYINAFGAEKAAPYALVITSSPVENLFIGLGWRAPLRGQAYDDPTTTSANEYKTGTPRLGDNYTGIQIGAGYTIENIGSIRAQFFGPYPLEVDKTATNEGWNSLADIYYNFNNAATAFHINPANVSLGGKGIIALNDIAKFNSIQAGFAVTALKSIGLDLDIVAKIPLPVTVKEANLAGIIGGTSDTTITLGAPVKIGVVAAFAAGNISVNGGIGVALPYTAVDSNASGYKPIENDAIELKFNVEPALKIGDSVTVGADIAFVLDPGQKSGFKQNDVYTLSTNGKDKVGTPMDLGLGAFVKYAVGKGTLKTGIAVTIPNLGGLDFLGGPDTYSNAVNFKIPLTVTVGF